MQGMIPFTGDAKKVMELGLREALMIGHNYIGTEHLLLGLASDLAHETSGASILQESLVLADVKPEVIRLLSWPRGFGASVSPHESSMRPIDPEVWLPDLLQGLEDAVARLLGEERVDEAAELRSRRRTLVRAVAAAQAGLAEAGMPPSRAAGGKEGRNYDVQPLTGQSSTWPQQLERFVLLPYLLLVALVSLGAGIVVIAVLFSLK
jgi:hypothetical protein